MLATGVGARRLASGAWAGFVGYETPFALEATAGAPALAPLTTRVVTILVDGLGAGPARDLPFLNELRARGADYDCRIGLPSLSLPGRAVLATGAWQEVHGQTTNMKPRRLRVDHVYAAARRRGLRTAMAAGEKTLVLFDPHVTEKVVYEESPESGTFEAYARVLEHQVAESIRLLRAGAELTALELYVVDEVGHGWGGTSPEYARAARAADDALRRIAAELDLASVTLLVTADHGHVPWGGHGGEEPEVMRVPLVLAGAGVRAGVRGECRQVDVAPTVAALLGTAIPASSQGRPLVEALALVDAARAAVLSAAVVQRERFQAVYAERVRTLVRGDAATPAPVTARRDGEGPHLLAARLDALDAGAEAVRAQAANQDARRRAAYAMLLAVAPFALLGVLRAWGLLGARESWAALGSALLGVAAYHALMPAFGLGYSMTLVNKDEWMEAFFRKDMILGVSCAAGAVALASRWALRGLAVTAAQGAVLSLSTVLVFCGALLVKVAVVYWREGALLVWRMPDMAWAFGFYLDVLAVMAVAFASPLLAVLGWLVARRATSRSDRPAV